MKQIQAKLKMQLTVLGKTKLIKQIQPDYKVVCSSLSLSFGSKC